MFIYFCEICDFKLLSYKVEPKLKCHCGCYALHEEEEIE